MLRGDDARPINKAFASSKHNSPVPPRGVVERLSRLREVAECGGTQLRVPRRVRLSRGPARQAPPPPSLVAYFTGS